MMQVWGTDRMALLCNSFVHHVYLFGSYIPFIAFASIFLSSDKEQTQKVNNW